jgi:polysaccharide export outer membrane protein
MPRKIQPQAIDIILKLELTAEIEIDMKTRFPRSLLLTICCLPALGLAQAQPGAARPVLSAAPAAQAPPETRAALQAAGPLTLSPNYIIGAADSIRIDVRTVDAQTLQLQVMATESGQQSVRPDGKITLPLLGDIEAAGFTPEQLAADIKARISQYYNDPIVTVTVLGVNSKQVYFAGDGVSRAGSMAISPGMTILQAIASAGISPFANKKHIYILRGDPARPQKIMFNYDKAVKKGDMQGVSLVPGDTIVIP